MKLLFICGCIEPGKDGVGDYTRLLASELIKAGQQVNIIALYDHFVSEEVEEYQVLQEVKLKVWRLSINSTRKERLEKAKERLKEFNPEWVSLQFVPYSFHSKGLNLRLPFLLEQLSDKFYWHLMIHEPWLYGRGIKYRHKFISHIQRKLLKMVKNKLDPKIIHTSNSYYQKILMAGGIKTELLNLPGNIPVHKDYELQIVKEFATLGITKDSRKEFLILGTFGTIRLQISYVAVIESQIKGCRLENKKLAFFSIGKTGNAATEIFKEIRNKFKDEILLYRFGEKSPAEISTFFRLLDYGVSCLPHHLLGKSGAYAAMREHNIKILIPEIDTDATHISKRERLEFSNYLLNLPDECFSAQNVTNQFLDTLT